MITQELLKNVTDLTLYTGTNGKDKCTCKCPGCTQINKGEKSEGYQGNIEQIKEILEILPNLKNAYILGNPDITVDSEFCNLAAKEFVKHGKNVMFSTSGFNALETIKKVTEDIEPSKISYISISVDSVDEEKLAKLKGNKNISLQEIGKAIVYCKENNIPVKIQPTLWQINQDDYKEIMHYFYNKYNVDWYTFHIGSFEAINGIENDILKHITQKKCNEIRENIKKIADENNLRVNIPKIFLTQEEYKEYDNSTTYCRVGGKGLQIWLEEGNLKCTFCPIYTVINKNFWFNPKEKETNLISSKTDCIAEAECISNNLKNTAIDSNLGVYEDEGENYYCICRFCSDKINY